MKQQLTDLGKAQADFHRRRHRGYRLLAVADCFLCQKSKAVCRRKIRLLNREQAEEWALDFGAARQFKEVVIAYWCRWCGQYHTMTPKTDAQRRRALKAQRQWLVSRENARRRSTQEGPASAGP